MRDPAARLQLTDRAAIRHLHAPLPPSHFLRSALARRWATEARMVPFEVRGEHEIVAPRLPFVSRPDEWCDAQLHAAAAMTLDLQQEAVAGGFDLKDASAWNVLFNGTEPVFCDLLSFEELRDRRWWAAGQFARHFVLPLVLSRRRGLRAHQCFASWLDGVPSDSARRLLGPARYASRYWPLLMDADGSAQASDPPVHESIDAVRHFREGLHASLRWLLRGVAPGSGRSAPTPWSDYVDERDHYAGDSLRRKRAHIATWLSGERPGWVLDLGCNTGEFALMAIDHGAEVVAIDGDHECVQRLFLSSPNRRLHPLLASLDDLPGERGWAGREQRGLAERLGGRFDMVMMLGLVHHLMIAASIPIEQVAQFAAQCTRRWLIVEWIDGTDRQARLLCAQRRRDVSEFRIDAQREAFSAAGFSRRRGRAPRRHPAHARAAEA